MEIFNFLEIAGIPTLTIFLLIIIGFSAGFVDAVVGGGGTIMVPGLINLLPQINIPTLFGTNKIASIAGTSVASYKYSRQVIFDWKWLIPSFIATVLFAIAGGKLATVVPTVVFRPIILFFLLWVAYLTFFPRKLVKKTEPQPINIKLIAGVCAVIGFYDGFIGPGTGIFLIFIFVQYFGFNFLQASAYSKIINVASNVGALIYFIPNGYFLGKLAVILIVCNISGAYLGSVMAINRGERFVKLFFRIMVSLLLAKFVYDSLVLIING